MSSKVVIVVLLLTATYGFTFKANDLAIDTAEATLGDSVPTCFALGQCTMRLHHDYAILVDSNGVIVRDLREDEYAPDLRPKDRAKVVVIETKSFLKVQWGVR